MRQRRQVTRCPHGAFRRDQRIHLGIHQRNQRFNHAQANTGKTARQAVDFQHHNQTHHRVVQRLADTCRMGKHQRTLQILQIFRGDTGLGQQAKAGINAIRRTAFSDNIIDAGDAGVNSIDRPGIQTQFDRLLPDFT